MAVAFRSSATGVYGSTSCSKPTSVVSGDVLVAWVYVDGNPTLTGPTGWTQLDSVSVPGGPMQMSTWYKLAGGAEPATYTWATSSGLLAIHIDAFSGVDGTTPINAHGISAASTGNVSPPSITTTIDGCYLLACFVNYAGAATTPPTGFTETNDTDGLEECYKSQVTQGATGTLTPSGMSGASAAAIVAVAPPAAGGGTVSSGTVSLGGSGGLTSTRQLYPLTLGGAGGLTSTSQAVAIVTTLGSSGGLTSAKQVYPLLLGSGPDGLTATSQAVTTSVPLGGAGALGSTAQVYPLTQGGAGGISAISQAVTQAVPVGGAGGLSVTVGSVVSSGTVTLGMAGPGGFALGHLANCIVLVIVPNPVPMGGAGGIVVGSTAAAATTALGGSAGLVVVGTETLGSASTGGSGGLLASSYALSGATLGGSAGLAVSATSILTASVCTLGTSGAGLAPPRITFLNTLFGGAGGLLASSNVLLKSGLVAVGTLDVGGLAAVYGHTGDPLGHWVLYTSWIWRNVAGVDQWVLCPIAVWRAPGTWKQLTT